MGRKRIHLSPLWSPGKHLQENGFVSWQESLEANKCLEVKELPNKQVPGAVSSSSAVVLHNVHPWARNRLLVAFGVLSLAQKWVLPSFLIHAWDGASVSSTYHQGRNLVFHTVMSSPSSHAGKSGWTAEGPQSMDTESIRWGQAGAEITQPAPPGMSGVLVYLTNECVSWWLRRAGKLFGSPR